jgi:hypothetical protein
MSAVLRNLPFRAEEDEVVVGSERVRIKPYQIVLWVSLSAREVLELPARAQRFPAIIDTGHNHYFSINAQLASRWAGLAAGALPLTGAIRVRGQRLALHAASLWIHPNRPGRRDELSGAQPLLVKLSRGIALHPGVGREPGLPLLGLRALVENQLHVTVDAERCVVRMRTPDWRTALARWLLA